MNVNMKRSLILSVLGLLLMTLPAQAARVEVQVPPGVMSVSLLSAGTLPVLGHMRQSLEAEQRELDERFGVQALAEKLAQTETLIVKRRKTYEDTVASTRHRYLSQITVEVLSAEAFISPEASALGEITFTYRITNQTDRIVSDLVYAPRVGGISLPTSSRQMLELSHPDTLKFGIAPGKTLSNQGASPERFTFFIGELKSDQLAFIRKHIRENFHLDLKDLHFVERIDYKGQTATMDVEQAFAATLKPLKGSLDEALALRGKRQRDYQQAEAAFTEQLEEAHKRFSQVAFDLRHAAVRFSSPVANKHRCILNDIPPGTYLVYAPQGDGQALLQEITVPAGKLQLNLETTTKDPFLP